MQSLQTIIMVMRLVAMETPAHVRAVCTRPFLLLLKCGNEAKFNCEGLNCDFCCSIKFIQFGLDLKVTQVPYYCNTETLTVVGLAVL